VRSASAGPGRFLPEAGGVERSGDGVGALVQELGDLLPQDLAEQDEEQHEGDTDPGLRLGEEALMGALGAGGPG
jgi:hypothetical protein